MKASIKFSLAIIVFCFLSSCSILEPPFDEHGRPYLDSSAGRSVSVNFSAAHLEGFLGLHNEIWVTIYSDCLAAGQEVSSNYLGVINLSSDYDVGRTRTLKFKPETTYYIKFGFDDAGHQCVIPFKLVTESGVIYEFTFNDLGAGCQLGKKMTRNDVSHQIKPGNLSEYLPSSLTPTNSIIALALDSLTKFPISYEWRKCDYWENYPVAQNLVYPKHINTEPYVRSFDF